MQKVEKEEKKKKHMEKLGQRTSKVVTFWESRQKYWMQLWSTKAR